MIFIYISAGSQVTHPGADLSVTELWRPSLQILQNLIFFSIYSDGPQINKKLLLPTPCMSNNSMNLCIQTSVIS